VVVAVKVNSTGVLVLVGRAVSVGLAEVCVGTAVFVLVDVWVSTAVGVRVAVPVAVRVRVAVGGTVLVGLGCAVFVGTLVFVAVGLTAWGVGVTVGVLVSGRLQAFIHAPDSQ
jgi:hypothetical protein